MRRKASNLAELKVDLRFEKGRQTGLLDSSRRVQELALAEELAGALILPKYTQAKQVMVHLEHIPRIEFAFDSAVEALQTLECNL